VATRNHVHLPLDEEVTAIGGSYRLVKEERLEIDGRELLYTVGHGVFDTSCCGAGGCAYAIVAGHIIEWKSGATEDGRPVSIVEPVEDDSTRRELARAIKAREAVQDVRFA
jgi:hypothetical protein